VNSWSDYYSSQGVQEIEEYLLAILTLLQQTTLILRFIPDTGLPDCMGYFSMSHSSLSVIRLCYLLDLPLTMDHYLKPPNFGDTEVQVFFGWVTGHLERIYSCVDPPTSYCSTRRLFGAYTSPISDLVVGLVAFAIPADFLSPKTNFYTLSVVHMHMKTIQNPE
jgi:hypothetical protein